MFILCRNPCIGKCIEKNHDVDEGYLQMDLTPPPQKKTKKHIE